MREREREPATFVIEAVPTNFFLVLFGFGVVHEYFISARRRQEMPDKAD